MRRGGRNGDGRKGDVGCRRVDNRGVGRREAGCIGVSSCSRR